MDKTISRSAAIQWLRELAATCKAECVRHFTSGDDETGETWRVRGESYAFIADQIERGVVPHG